MGTIPTVRIKRLSQSVVINAADFNPEKHELYVEPESVVEPEAVVEPEVADQDQDEIIDSDDEGIVTMDNTKDEIEAFAMENFGLDLDKRNTKENMLQKIHDYVMAQPEE